jgi:5-methylcytosine-specific restriction endonuclease McrA
MRVLVLSQAYEPIGTISWKKAVGLFFLKKVHVLSEYDEYISSPSFKMKIPSVIAMKNGKHRKINSIRFSRKNIWLRDEGQCQYCNKNVKVNDFTIDHVFPKTAGGTTNWDNVVVSCYVCNQRKGGQSLKECGYKLKKTPKKPSSLPYINEITGFYNDNYIHPNWKFWIER